MRKFTLLLLLIPWLASAQSSDTLWCYTREQVSRMMYEIEKGRQCDTLQAYQYDVIKKAVWTIQTQDSLLTLRATEINILTQQSKYWQALDSNSQERIKEVAKDKNLFEFTTYATSGGAIGGAVAGPIGAGVGVGVGAVIWVVVKFIL